MQMVGEEFLLAGETSNVTAMREHPEEFAARMAVWEERVSQVIVPEE